MYVDPSARGTGAGKTLMEALELEVVRRGLSEVVIESSPSAESFYAGLRYQPVEPVSFRRGDAEFRCVRMLKKLVNETS